MEILDLIEIPKLNKTTNDIKNKKSNSHRNDLIKHRSDAKPAPKNTKKSLKVLSTNKQHNFKKKPEQGAVCHLML